MKKIFTIICLVIICCNVSAQETYNKDFAISVKKNSEYFYGEASDTETAFNKLLKKIKSYNDFDSPIDTTAAGARKKSRHFEYQKNSKTKVTLYYVLKKDLAITENADNHENSETESQHPDENAPVIDFVLNYNNYQDLRQYLDKRKNGYHNVTVSKPTFRTVDFYVNLTGEPIEKNITLTNASVEIKVEKEYDAVLYVDGVRYGTQNTVRVSADSKHTIKIEKNGHTKSKTVKAEQYNFTVVMPSFSNSQVTQSNWFIGGTFSPQLMSGGISVGRCERAGFILNAGVSKLAVNNWHYRSLEKGGLLDTFKISNIYSTKLLDNSELKSAKKKGLYRSYVRIGPMFRLFDFAYIYGAVGCGTYADVKEYDSYLYAPSKHSGFEGEVGLMLKYKSLGVSAGYTQSIGKGKDFSDYHIGLNYWMNVLTKHINPRHRFIVGYRYSPSAPIGMSLGVSFGYYEKWGLVVNGGFAQYNMHVWAERSKDYSPEGFWINEIHTVSHKNQYEGENCKHNGIFRAYYHIGPFFRINDVFSYYVTVGYGNYAHLKRHPDLTYSILSGTTNFQSSQRC